MRTQISEELRADVKHAIVTTVSLGPLGAFSSAADVASIAGTWGFLLVRYALYYDFELDLETAKKYVQQHCWGWVDTILVVRQQQNSFC